MTIGKKISQTCAALVVLTTIQGTVAILNVSHMDSEVTSLIEGPLPGLYSLSLIQGNIKEEKIAKVEHMASDSPEQKSRLESKLADLESTTQAEMKVYRKTIRTGKGQELLDKWAGVEEGVARSWAAILPLSRALKTKEALALWTGEAAVAHGERARLFDEILAQRKSMADENGRSSLAAGESARFWVIAILVFSVLAGGLSAFIVVRGVNQALSKAVTELSESAGQVSSASGQISGSSQSLAQGSSEQAASLEETSASSEEMASMTRKNAENSQQAAVLMNAVSQRVADANGALADMMTSMEEIGASSGKISKIIKVIDEIAFQTNILALNAAVEAARAGEAGMGFAVVADEVRNLAQRSAQAAKDTAALIEDSILKSGEGSTKLGEVAGSIRAITEGAGQAKVLVDEVEASSKEQAQGIEQISKAVAQMDEVTQRTAANAEESASASEELNAQSRVLMVVVNQLQALVGGDSGRPAAPRKTIAAIQPRRALADNTRRLRAEPPAALKPVPVLAGSTARRGSEFPLDDSEFKEF